MKCTRPQPKSWEELFSCATVDYPYLKFTDSIHKSPALKREPFDKTIAKSANELCRILNWYMEVANEQGHDSTPAKEIFSTYFPEVGHRFQANQKLISTNFMNR